MAYQFFLERGGAGGHGPLNAVAYQFFEFSLRNQRLLFCLTTLLLPPPISPNPHWGKYTIGASDGGCGRCRQHPQPSDWGQNGICSKNRTMTVISSIHIFMNRAPVLADVVALIGCLIDGD